MPLMSVPGAMERKRYQLSHLCVLQAALTECCRHLQDITYGSYKVDKDISMPPFHKFLCKIAQLLHNEKGGDTNSSVACLVSPGGGAEIVFASNFRKDPALQEMKRFLEDLLGYVSMNPDELGVKALQKKILWKILEFSFKKVETYLNQLSTVINQCIQDSLVGGDDSVTDSLQELESKLPYSLDITSSPNSKQKILSDCERFIRAIEASKNTPLTGEIDRNATQLEPETAYKWCHLRHLLGRIYSFRQAAEVIAAAPSAWPELFRSFIITPVDSAKRTKIPLPQSATLVEILEASFPGVNLNDYATDINYLRDHGLDALVSRETLDRNIKTSVHAEVKLHEYLVRERKVTKSDFWDGEMFIATSKPTCQLCHYYFQASENDDFSVQSPHMNLYPKWRVPDLCSEEVMDDIIDDMQKNALKLFKEKLPQWRRYDSRTDSWVYDGHNTRQSMRTGSRESAARPGQHRRDPDMTSVPRRYAPPSSFEDPSWEEDFGPVGSERAPRYTALNGKSYDGSLEGRH